MSIRGLDRPLNLGEILDRAVTLSVQRFPMLIALLAVVAVPLAIVQSFSANPLNQYISAIQAAAKGGSKDVTKILASIPQAGVRDYVIIGTAFLLGPLMVGALTIAIARSLDAEPFSIGSTYRTALRRWPSMLAVGLIWILIAAVALLALSIVLGLIIFALVRTLGSAVPAPGAIGFTVLIILVFFLVSAPLGAIGYALGIVSLTSAVLETLNPFTAIGRAFARIFARREFLRSIVVSLALFAVSFAMSLLGAVLGGVVFALTKWVASYIVIAQIFNSAGLIFTTATATIYYFDVRLRREGSDLIAAPSSVPLAPLP